MSDRPVDVQAERLRELALAAVAGQIDGGWYLDESSGLAHMTDSDDRAFVAACDPQTILALLDQAEGHAAFRDHERVHELEDSVAATESQRDNLRDALQDIASMTVMSAEGTQMKYWAEKALAALRAAAVDEGTDA